MGDGQSLLRLEDDIYPALHSTVVTWSRRPSWTRLSVLPRDPTLRVAYLTAITSAPCLDIFHR